MLNDVPVLSFALVGVSCSCTSSTYCEKPGRPLVLGVWPERIQPLELELGCAWRPAHRPQANHLLACWWHARTSKVLVLCFLYNYSVFAVGRPLGST